MDATLTILYSVLLLLSGLGVFLYGIHTLGQGIKNLTSQSFRSKFQKVTKNPISSYGIGLGTTLLVENSSVTSVVVVGMLNAGVITLYQGLAMLLGANLGAMLILIIFCFSSVFNLVDILSLTLLIGAIMVMFARQDKTQRIGKIIVAFGMLFLGLKVMSLSMTNIMEIQGASEFVSGISNIWLLLLIGILFGATFHVLGTTYLMISLVDMPSSPFTAYFAIIIVLGACIGTTITTILASLNSNIHSKRAAIFNTLVNIVGSLIMLIIVTTTGWIDWLSSFLPSLSFVIVFTVITLSLIVSIIFMPLLNQLEKLMQTILKDKSSREPQAKIFTISQRELNDIVIVQNKLKQGINIIFDSIKSIYKQLQNSLENINDKPINYKKLENKINKTRNYIDDTKNNILRINTDKTQTLLRELNTYNESLLESETLLDEALKILNKSTEMKASQKKFLKAELDVIKEIFATLDELFEQVIKMLNDKEQNSFNESTVESIEQKIYSQNLKAKQILMKSLQKEENKSNYDILFSVIGKLIRACDHTINLIIKSI